MGGRWNSPGTAMVYTSSHLSLAALELLVHIAREDEPPDLVAVYGELDEAGIEEWLLPSQLPEGWRRVTGSPELKSFGDIWISEEKSPAIALPSVIIPEEYNLLLNPEHPEFSSVFKPLGARPFSFDSRYFS